jgi:chromosome partitioning protein
MELIDYFKKPLVISFLQEKGGAGKTTLATNVARGLIIMGLNVLLVDSDKQRSATKWGERWGEACGDFLVPVVGLATSTLDIELRAIKNNFHVIVIDGAPGFTKQTASSIKASDIILIPVQPSQYDIAATEGLVDLIEARQEVIGESSLHAAFIVSRAIRRTKLSHEVIEALKEHNIPTFMSFTTQLIEYAASASAGKSVFENKQPITSARLEIESIIFEILRSYVYGPEDQ